MREPCRTAGSPLRRVRAVVPEDRRPRAVAFISLPAHSPSQSSIRSHLLSPHSVTTASTMSECHIVVTSDCSRGFSESHHFADDELDRLLGVSGGPYL